jgi:hypothetical protein
VPSLRPHTGDRETLGLVVVDHRSRRTQAKWHPGLLMAVWSVGDPSAAIVRARTELTLPSIGMALDRFVAAGRDAKIRPEVDFR